MIAHTKHQDRDYILTAERGLDHPTVFKIGTLSVREKARLADRVGAFSGGDLQPKAGMADAMIEAVRVGVVGWENLVDADGNQVPCTREPDGPGGRQVLTEDALDALGDLAVIAELFAAVMGENEIDEDDEGNSGASPPSPGGGPSSATG